MYQQNLLDHFWKRWKRDYLLNLRSANLCFPVSDVVPFKVDDIVLIGDERFPRNIWTIARVNQVFYGRDGKIRSCQVKTPTGNIRRPVQLLYNLELN